MEDYKLHVGDCIEVMRGMADASVDAIVTDPPYELGFMGKSWDASGIAYNVDMWREALRVLKPGGHLLAFSGSRTYHRMTCAIEDAGFEVRDQIMWVYGSGFPKSLDVSKVIDKMGGREGMAVRDEIARLIVSSRLSDQEIALACGVSVALARFWRLRERNIMPAEAKKLRAILGNGEIDVAEREVVGKAAGTIGRGRWREMEGRTDEMPEEYDVTAPTTDAARQWEGWGTALKPAHEPICVARKPLVGTVAANVLMYGTGALNIDGCRVEPTGESRSREHESADIRVQPGVTSIAATAGAHRGGDPLGRWPANLIHDGSDEVVALFPAQAGASAPVRGTEASAASVGRVTGERERVAGVFHADSGSAARFFYCAKASRADRNDGLDGMPEKPSLKIDPTSAMARDGNRGSGMAANHHPTVKPTDLMAYLVRLVTPPGGTVLDPFMGSGSTGKAAMREGFQFVGIDMTPEYVEIATARIEHELSRVTAAKTPPPPAPQMDLFAPPPEPLSRALSGAEIENNAEKETA